jgi:hypothetical protein
VRAPLGLTVVVPTKPAGPKPAVLAQIRGDSLVIGPEAHQVERERTCEVIQTTGLRPFAPDPGL